jgi:hypothetical protein
MAAFKNNIQNFFGQLLTHQNLDAHPLIQQQEHRIREQEIRLDELERAFIEQGHQLRKEKDKTNQRKEENQGLRSDFSNSFSIFIDDNMGHRLRVQAARDELKKENKTLQEELLNARRRVAELELEIEGQLMWEMVFWEDDIDELEDWSVEALSFHFWIDIYRFLEIWEDISSGLL